MNLLKRSLLITILAGLLGLGLVFNPWSLVKAQLASVSSKIPNQWEDTFTPPPVGAPEGREGAATRGKCALDYQSDRFPLVSTSGLGRTVKDDRVGLTSLVPVSKVGTTIAEYPTLYWYMPKTSAKQMQFLLRDDENDKDVYSVTSAIARQQRGIMSLLVPALPTLSPLKIGKLYHWFVALICDPLNRSNDVVQEGWVVRVPSNPRLLSQIKTAPLEERVAIYAKSRPPLWYETLTTLVELQRLHPDDPNLPKAWAKLLRSVGLDEIAQEPMVVQKTAQRDTGIAQSLPQNP